MAIRPTYGHPPLSLDLRYLMTTHSAIETQVDADLNAQTILGDAMRVFNDFGNGIDQLAIVNPVAGTPGDPLLDPDLAREFERLKIVLHPATLDDITKVWSAVSGINFRRSCFTRSPSCRSRRQGLACGRSPSRRAGSS